MLAITPFVDQLKAGGCRNSFGAISMAALKDAPRALPAYFVVPTGENASANSQDRGRDQAVDASMSVVVVIDAVAANQAGQQEALRDAIWRVIDALVGWTHPDAARACSYSGGRLMSADGHTLEWEVRLTTRHHLRRKS